MKHLDLSFTAIGDASLAVLRNMPEIEFFDLSDTLVTDEGLAPLRSLPALKELRLSTTAITDKALDVLGDLALLKKLDINSTVITPDGVARLDSRLPHTIVTFTDHGERAADSVARDRIQRLMAARRWSDALQATRQCHSSDLERPDVLFDFARCHVGLAQWDKAESEYREALTRLARDPAQQHWFADKPWHELSAWSPLFERVAKARPNDFWRWMASARRAVLAGKWSAAVRDYARAAECRRATVFTRGRRSTLVNCEFEYVLSRLLEGDVAEQRRVSALLFENDRQVVEEEDETTWFRDNWKAATHLSFVAPQGTVGSSQIAAWLEDGASSWWKIYELQPLIFCRAAMFDAALERKPPDDDEHVGRYWRGLSDDVLLVVMGEMSHTPRLSNFKGQPGREHWARSMSILLAGGGLRTGQVVGSTTPKGDEPAERPMTPNDVLATWYHVLGIPLDTQFVDHFGRPIPILSHGSRIRELI